MQIYPKFLKNLNVFLPILLTALMFALPIAAQQTMNAVDASFNAVPDKDPLAPPNFVVQPDNKIIVFGNFQTVRGTLKNQIARLNQDGSLDNAFDCQVCSFTPNNVLVQSDGKIYVSGTLNGGLQAVVYRLNPDGSRDQSFNSPFPALPGTVVVSFSTSATIEAVQPDGKVLVTIYNNNAGFFDASLNRLNADGTLDSTFTVSSIGGGRLVRTNPLKVAVQPDGKILVATNTFSGGGSSGNIRRLNANGSTDTTFEVPSIIGDGGSTNGFPRSSISDFDVRADGSMFIVGEFVTVNAVSRRNVVKLSPAGNVDASFVSSASISETIKKVKSLADGKVLLLTDSRVYRLNANGSLDENFPLFPSNINAIYSWSVDAAGRIVLYGAFTEGGTTGARVNQFVRLNQNGSVESSFRTNFGIAASVTTVAAQADGKVLFAGDFLRVGGAARPAFARVNADGSLDTTFNTGSGFRNDGVNPLTISKIFVQNNGKIIVTGNFSSYNGAPREAMARLNADGTLDNTFAPQFGLIPIETVALQADGKILIGGGTSFPLPNGIARLNADGSFDTSFNPTFGNPFIRSIAVQADGKILVGGSFSGVNGFSRTALVRLNADGTVDGAFNAGNLFTVNQIEIQADGKYLISTGSLVRLNNNGTTDTSFTSPNFTSSSSNAPLLQFLAQPDGTILVGGSFSSVNSIPRSNFVRLRPSGALDTAFFPTGANNAVRTIVRQANGQILVGGDFSVIGGVARLSIARVNVAAYRPITPYDFDGDGRADVAVFRPSNGNWYILPSATNSFYGFPFGQAGDQIAPADYDGDGKTDIAVFRETVAGAGDKAYFYIFNSSDNSFRPVQFGTQGDVPFPGDWDGDGKIDIAVYRAAPATGGLSYFFYRPSAQPTVDYVTIPFSSAGDKPVPADYDGDGRIDPATVQTGSGTGVWRILYSSTNQLGQVFFGVTNDIPTPADYDGDGKANIAVFRPSNGTWYTSQNPQNNYGAIQFGASGDLPIPADYDGDGRADVAVFRPSNGAWYLNRSTSGFTGVQFGVSGDKPAPNAFVR